MINLTINVEVLAGTSIGIASDDIVALSRKLDIMVRTKFNGISLYATPQSNAIDIEKSYMDAVRRERRTDENPTE
jgi:hypothetical protein